MVRAANLVTEFEVGGRNVTLRVRHNPRARRMILKIDHTSGEVHVTAPTKKSMKEALSFAAREESWIRKKLAELPSRQSFVHGAGIPLRGSLAIISHRPERRRGVWYDPGEATICVSGDAAFVPRRVGDWLRREARSALVGAVSNFTKELALPLPKVTIRDTTSRWGSCSSTGTLSFSWRLILAPPEILTYVAAHETAHLKHLNHSRAFWTLLEHLDPDYKTAEAWMKSHAVDLFRYG